MGILLYHIDLVCRNHLLGNFLAKGSCSLLPVPTMYKHFFKCCLAQTLFPSKIAIMTWWFCNCLIPSPCKKEYYFWKDKIHLLFPKQTEIFSTHGNEKSRNCFNFLSTLRTHKPYLFCWVYHCRHLSKVSNHKNHVVLIWINFFS